MSLHQKQRNTVMTFKHTSEFASKRRNTVMIFCIEIVYIFCIET